MKESNSRSRSRSKYSRSRSSRMSRSDSRSSRSRSYSRGRGSRSRSPTIVVDTKTFVVFVRGLNRNCREPELREEFKSCGEILSCSIITDRKDGRSKGFGFIAFSTQEGQNGAIAKDGQSFMGSTLCVQKSTRKTTIYVGGLPSDYDADKDEEDLRRAIEDRCGKTVTEIRSKGRYAFCEFVNFDHTQLALQRVPGMVFRGSEIRVQLANPERSEQEKDEYRPQPKQTLYVRDISRDVDEKDLRKFFQKFGELTRCEIIKDSQGENREYGFVGFKSREDAEAAFKEAHGQVLGEREIQVEFAKSKGTKDKRTEGGRGRDRFGRKDRDRSRSYTREKRGCSRVEIDDVLSRGVPVMVFDASVGRYVLLTPDDHRGGSRRDRDYDRRDRYRDRGRY